MHRRPAAAFLFVSFLASLGGSQETATINPPAEGASPVARADALIDALAGDGSPAVAVLVSRDGQILLKKAVGLADVENERKATPETIFRIGSVTKQFTAAAILKLAEQDKLSVDDTLDKYLPDFPRGGDVTIRQLLQHTSGIPSYTDDPAFMTTVALPVSEDEIVARFAGKEFLFEPGTKFKYNNSGYFLLGHLVGKLSGMPLPDFWRNTFFEPLGMTRSGSHRPDLGLVDEALGYAVTDGVRPAINWHMSQAGGAGEIYSTVGDLFRWNEALFGGKVLSDESLEAMLTVSEVSKGDMNYGFGVMISEERGVQSVSHGGGLQGFQSYLAYYPEQRVTIAVMHNALPGNPGMGPGPLAKKLEAIFLAEDMEPLPDRIVDKSFKPEVFDRYAGRYDYGTAVMTATREGDQFYIQLTGQPRFEVFPESKTKFFLTAVNAQVEFVPGDDGRAVAVEHTQGPRNFTAPRIEDDAAAPSEEELEPYVGSYNYITAKMTVSRIGRQLQAKLTGQPTLPIFPTEEKDKFEWRAVEASIRFLRDEDGKVVAGMHSQNGNEFRVEKID